MARPVDPALLPHLRPGRTALLLTVLLGVVGGLATLAQAFAAGHLIVALVGDPTGSGWHAAGWWLAGATLTRVAAGWGVDVASSRAAGQVSGALRERLVDAALDLDADRRDTRTSGELTVLATRGLGAIEPYLTRYLPTLVLAAVLPAAGLVAIFALDWLSGVIVLATLPLVPVFAILIGLATQEKADRQWRQLSALAGHFLDVVRGLPTLVTHRRARAQSRRIRTITHEYRRSTLDTLRTAFASSVALELIATLSVALVAVCVGLRLASGGVDFTTALIVLLLAPEAYWPLRRVGAEFHAAAEGVAAFTRADELLTEAGATAAGTREVTAGAGLSLHEVSLTWPGREHPALGPLSHSFPRTGFVAITGPSGCGKSTLLSLLRGDRTPSSGSVRVGDVPLAEADLPGWWSQVAWAPQRPWLTEGSVAENVLLARPDAEEAEVWEALEAVDLGTVVSTLPHGLETVLGEDGAGLSAGQRARLALARVVLADRPVVLLDEPSAHLDAETEAVLLRTLARLAQDRLVIAVAHRAALIEAADEVLTLPAATTSTAIPTVTVEHAGAPEVPAQTRSPHAEATAPGTEATAHPEPPADAPVDAPAGAAGGPDESLRDPVRFGGLRTATFLGTLSTASGVALTATAAWLITRASEHPPVLYLMVAIVGVRLFGLARPVLRYAERLLSHDHALRVLAERRARVYDVLVPLVPGALGRRRGDLLTSVVDDVDAVVDAQLRVRQPLVTGVWVGVLATLAAALITPVAGAVVGLMVIVAIGAALLTRHRVRSTEAAFVQARADLTSAVEHVAHNAGDLLAWQATAVPTARLHDAAARQSAAATGTVRAVATGHALVMAAATAAVLATAALAGGSGVSPAMLALVTMLPLGLVDALAPMTDAAALSVRTAAAEERLQAFNNLVPAVREPADPAPLGAGPVAVDDVLAGWGTPEDRTSEDSRLVDLRGVDLGVAPGQRVGLVGPSGSGKSTAAALLLRFLDPRSGTVSIGGTDLRAASTDEVRTRVGLVDDDPYLFASTVAENVRLARHGASDAEVHEALSRAGLGSWLQTLPEGAATFIGEGHAHVSGGERARIAIARALLAAPEVLVLDEPTAHLDSETAHRVSTELLSSTAGRGVLWITHGTVALDRMDRVVTLGGPTASLPAQMAVGVPS